MSGYFFDFSDKDILTPPIFEVDGQFYRTNPMLAGSVEEQATKKTRQLQEEDASGKLFIVYYLRRLT